MREDTNTEATEGSGLRAKLEEALAENKTLKADKLNDAFGKLDLDPTEGLGKAIAKEYKGEVSLDALTAYAKDEYNYSYTPEPEANPVATAIETEQARLDTVGETAGSVVTQTETEILAEAEAAGDYKTTMAIKANQIAAQAQRQQGR